MANQLGIIHPRLFDSLPYVYPSLCTIRKATEAADSYGQLQPTWSNFTGHIDLDCRVSPWRDGREVRQTEQTYVADRFVISLAGHYPTITEKMRALVDSATTYEVEIVQHDGNSKMTRLICRIVN